MKMKIILILPGASIVLLENSSHDIFSISLKTTENYLHTLKPVYDFSGDLCLFLSRPEVSAQVVLRVTVR